MARLEIVDGGWLELRPIGLQFAKGDPDGWLYVELACELEDGSREPTIEAAFTQPEFTSLISWLGAVARREVQPGDHWGALEPCLAATLLRNYELSVELELALSHEWRLLPDGSAERARITVTRERLQDFSGALRAELSTMGASGRAR